MTEKPKRKRGRKPQPRLNLEISMPENGADPMEWAEQIISGLAEIPVITKCAKLQIWVGSKLDLFRATGAVIELLQAAGVLHRKARVTDIIGHVDKTVAPLTARVEIAGTVDPDHRPGIEARKSVIRKNIALYDMLRQLTKNGASHAFA